MIPSNEQLANFAVLRCFGAHATELQRDVARSLIEASPVMRELWLEQHAAFEDELRQVTASGATSQRA